MEIKLNLITFLFATVSTASVDTNSCGETEALPAEVGANATIVYKPNKNRQERTWYFRAQQIGGDPIFNKSLPRDSTSRYDEYKNGSDYILNVINVNVNDSGFYSVQCGQTYSPYETYLNVTVGTKRSPKTVFAVTTTSMSTKIVKRTTNEDLEKVESIKTTPFKASQSNLQSVTKGTETQTSKRTVTSIEDTADNYHGTKKGDILVTLIGPVVGAAGAIVALVITIAICFIIRNNKKQRVSEENNDAKRNKEQNHDARQKCTLQETSKEQQVRPVSQKSDTAVTEYASVVLNDDRTQENKLIRSDQKVNEEQEVAEYSRVVKKQRETCNIDEMAKNMVAEEDAPEYSRVLKKKSEACKIQQITEKMNNEHEMPEYSCVVKKQADTSSSEKSTEKIDNTEDRASKRNTNMSVKGVCKERADKTKERELVYVEPDLSHRPADRPVIKEYEATEYVSIDIEKTEKLKAGKSKMNSLL